MLETERQNFVINFSEKVQARTIEDPCLVMTHVMEISVPLLCETAEKMLGTERQNFVIIFYDNGQARTIEDPCLVIVQKKKGEYL